MHSHSDLEIKLRLVLGLILLSLVVVLLLRLLLPVLATIGFIAGGYWLWQQYRNQQQRHQRQQARVHAQFYQLLRQQRGRISVLDFAMRTRLSGADAQDYLNRQAQAFCAFFETTMSGDLIYVFNTTHADRVQQEQNYQTRAYSERAKAEQIYAQQAQTAWTNAKQVRTLRQLSKKGKEHIMREHIAQIDTQPKLIEASRSTASRSEAKRQPTNHQASNTERDAKQSTEPKNRYINIDIDQTELEQKSSRNYAENQTIDVTAVRS